MPLKIIPLISNFSYFIGENGKVSSHRWQNIIKLKSTKMLMSQKIIYSLKLCKLLWHPGIYDSLLVL